MSGKRASETCSLRCGINTDTALVLHLSFELQLTGISTHSDLEVTAKKKKYSCDS